MPLHIKSLFDRYFDKTSSALRSGVPDIYGITPNAEGTGFTVNVSHVFNVQGKSVEIGANIPVQFGDIPEYLQNADPQLQQPALRIPTLDRNSANVLSGSLGIMLRDAIEGANVSKNYFSPVEQLVQSIRTGIEATQNQFYSGMPFQDTSLQQNIMERISYGIPEKDVYQGKQLVERRAGTFMGGAQVSWQQSPLAKVFTEGRLALGFSKVGGPDAGELQLESFEKQKMLEMVYGYINNAMRGRSEPVANVGSSSNPTIDIFSLLPGYAGHKPEQNDAIDLYYMARGTEGGNIYDLGGGVKGATLGKIYSRHQVEPLGADWMPLNPNVVDSNWKETYNKATWIKGNAILPGENTRESATVSYGLMTLGFPAAGAGIHYEDVWGRERYGFQKSPAVKMGHDVLSLIDNPQNLALNPYLFSSVVGGGRSVQIGDYTGNINGQSVSNPLSVEVGASEFMPQRLKFYLPQATNDLTGLGTIYDTHRGGQTRTYNAANPSQSIENFKNGLLLGLPEEKRAEFASRIDVQFTNEKAESFLEVVGYQGASSKNVAYAKSFDVTVPGSYIDPVTSARIGTVTGEIKVAVAKLAASIMAYPTAVQSEILSDYAAKLPNGDPNKDYLTSLITRLNTNAYRLDMNDLGQGNEGHAWELLKDMMFGEKGLATYAPGTPENLSSLQRFRVGQVEYNNVPMGTFEYNQFETFKEQSLSFMQQNGKTREDATNIFNTIYQYTPHTNPLQPVPSSANHPDFYDVTLRHGVGILYPEVTYHGTEHAGASKSLSYEVMAGITSIDPKFASRMGINVHGGQWARSKVSNAQKSWNEIAAYYSYEGSLKGQGEGAVPYLSSSGTVIASKESLKTLQQDTEFMGLLNTTANQSLSPDQIKTIKKKMGSAGLDPSKSIYFPGAEGFMPSFTHVERTSKLGIEGLDETYSTTIWRDAMTDIIEANPAGDMSRAKKAFDKVFNHYSDTLGDKSDLLKKIMGVDPQAAMTPHYRFNSVVQGHQTFVPDPVIKSMAWKIAQYNNVGTEEETLLAIEKFLGSGEARAVDYRWPLESREKEQFLPSVYVSANYLKKQGVEVSDTDRYGYSVGVSLQKGQDWMFGDFDSDFMSTLPGVQAFYPKDKNGQRGKLVVQNAAARDMKDIVAATNAIHESEKGRAALRGLDASLAEQIQFNRSHKTVANNPYQTNLFDQDALLNYSASMKQAEDLFGGNVLDSEGRYRGERKAIENAGKSGWIPNAQRIEETQEEMGIKMGMGTSYNLTRRFEGAMAVLGMGDSWINNVLKGRAQSYQPYIDFLLSKNTDLLTVYQSASLNQNQDTGQFSLSFRATEGAKPTYINLSSGLMGEEELGNELMDRLKGFFVRPVEGKAGKTYLMPSSLFGVLAPIGTDSKELIRRISKVSTKDHQQASQERLQVLNQFIAESGATGQKKLRSPAVIAFLGKAMGTGERHGNTGLPGVFEDVAEKAHYARVAYDVLTGHSGILPAEEWVGLGKTIGGGNKNTFGGLVEGMQQQLHVGKYTKGEAYGLDAEGMPVFYEGAKHFKEGGLVESKTPGKKEVPAVLHEGEYVLTKEEAEQLGLNQGIHTTPVHNKTTLKDQITQKVIDRYGLTEDIQKAGFMLPDGRMIDLSQGHGRRYWGHSDVSENIEMGYGPNYHQMMKDMGGALRIAGANNYKNRFMNIGIESPLTRAQKESLEQHLGRGNPSSIIITADIEFNNTRMAAKAYELSPDNLGEGLSEMSELSRGRKNISHFDSGGLVKSKTPGKKEVPAVLHEGEYVLTKEETEKLGLGKGFDAIKKGDPHSFSSGGPVNLDAVKEKFAAVHPWVKDVPIDFLTEEEFANRFSKLKGYSPTAMGVHTAEGKLAVKIEGNNLVPFTMGHELTHDVLRSWEKGTPEQQSRLAEMRSAAEAVYHSNPNIEAKYKPREGRNIADEILADIGGSIFTGEKNPVLPDMGRKKWYQAIKGAVGNALKEGPATPPIVYNTANDVPNDPYKKGVMYNYKGFSGAFLGYTSEGDSLLGKKLSSGKWEYQTVSQDNILSRDKRFQNSYKSETVDQANEEYARRKSAQASTQATPPASTGATQANSSAIPGMPTAAAGGANNGGTQPPSNTTTATTPPPSQPSGNGQGNQRSPYNPYSGSSIEALSAEARLFNQQFGVYGGQINAALAGAARSLGNIPVEQVGNRIAELAQQPGGREKLSAILGGSMMGIQNAFTNMGYAQKNAGYLAQVIGASGDPTGLMGQQLGQDFMANAQATPGLMVNATPLARMVGFPSHAAMLANAAKDVNALPLAARLRQEFGTNLSVLENLESQPAGTARRVADIINENPEFAQAGFQAAQLNRAAQIRRSPQAIPEEVRAIGSIFSQLQETGYVQKKPDYLTSEQRGQYNQSMEEARSRYKDSLEKLTDNVKQQAQGHASLTKATQRVEEAFLQHEKALIQAISSMKQYASVVGQVEGLVPELVTTQGGTPGMPKRLLQYSEMNAEQQKMVNNNADLMAAIDQGRELESTITNQTSKLGIAKSELGAAQQAANGRGGNLGGLARQLFGGFGLMYMGSILRGITGGAEMGYAENIQMQQQAQQGLYSYTGGAMFNPQTQLQQALGGLGGMGGRGLTQMQLWAAQNAPGLTYAMGLGQSSVFGGAGAMWMGSEIGQSMGMTNEQAGALGGTMGIAAAILSPMAQLGISVFGASLPQNAIGTAGSIVGTYSGNMTAPITSFKGFMQAMALGFSNPNTIALAIAEGAKALTPFANSTVGKILFPEWSSLLLDIANPKLITATNATSQLYQAAMSGGDLRSVMAAQVASGNIASGDVSQYMNSLAVQMSKNTGYSTEATGTYLGMKQAYGGITTSAYQTTSLLNALQMGVPVEQFASAILSASGMSLADQAARGRGMMIPQVATLLANQPGITSEMIQSGAATIGQFGIGFQMAANAQGGNAANWSTQQVMNLGQASGSMQGTLMASQQATYYGGIAMGATRNGPLPQYNPNATSTQVRLGLRSSTNQQMLQQETQNLGLQMLAAGYSSAEVDQFVSSSANQINNGSFTATDLFVKQQQVNFRGSYAQSVTAWGVSPVNANIAATNALAGLTPIQQQQVIGAAQFNAGALGVAQAQGRSIPGIPSLQGGIPYNMITTDTSKSGISTGMPLFTTSMNWGNPATNGLSGAQVMQQYFPGTSTAQGTVGGDLLAGGTVQAAAGEAQRQFQFQMAQIGVQQQQQNLNYAFTTGVGISNYSNIVNPQTGQPFNFNTGNFSVQMPYGGQTYTSQGGGIWGLQDTQMNLQWNQQQYGFNIQQQQLNMSNKYAQIGFQQTQQGFNIERGFQKEQWGYETHRRQEQWQWTQEDFQEKIRFESGRQRRLDERSMKRETTVYNEDTQQIQKQRKEQQDLWKLQDDQFRTQKQQFQESLSLQQQQLDKAREYFADQKTLTLESIALQRAEWTQQMALQNESLSIQAAQAKDQKDYQDAMIKINALQQGAQELSYATSTQQYNIALDTFNLYNQLLVLMGDTPISMPNTGGGGGGGKKVPTKYQKPSSVWQENVSFGNRYGSAQSGSIVVINIGNKNLGSFVVSAIEKEINV